LWTVFALSVLATDGYCLATLHRRFGWDALLGYATLVVRAALFISVGLLIEALLLRAGYGYLTENKTRRSVLHAYWIGVMLLGVALVADVVVYAFAGYHVPTGLRILMSDGPLGVVKVVDATGLSIWAVLLSAFGVGLGLGVAIVLSKVSRRFSSRAGILVSRRQALRAVLVCVGVLALVEMASYRLRDPFVWEREIREVPLAFSVLRPAAELASFRVSVRNTSSPPRVGAADPVAAPAGKPDIVVVIIESLRADMRSRETMPHFAEFAEHAWTFDHAVTTGNVTHYSWFGLLCGRIPLYFDVAKHSPVQSGSAAFAALRDAGYRVHLLATPDTEYQNLEAIVFGSGPAKGTTKLLTDKFHPTDPDVAHRDELVIEELTRRLGSTPPGGSAYVVALDSPHFGYQWGRGFEPPFRPYAADISIAEDYEKRQDARRSVINRYKNAVAWIDSLLGRFFHALEQSGRANDAILVITGDHGEAFWEHGSATHGSDLGAEQLEVAFAMKLPGQAARRRSGVFSLLDVMPTVLYAVGLGGVAMDGTPEQVQTARTASTPVGAVLPTPERVALTFQGWNERAYRFAATTEQRRLLFELDSVDPLEAKRLVLKHALDLGTTGRFDRERGDAGDDYEDVLDEVPGVLRAMTFLRLGAGR
jgi:glucan phosphoethanolaminetransferase (alkaline phosphatase superfamily)